jgi:hypothetical protein
MKKIILALTLLSAITTADACCYRGPYMHGGPVGCCVSGWIAPALVGGVIGYELARPNTVVVEQPGLVYTQPPVVVQPAPVMVQQPPAGYHWQQIIDPVTNTQKMALVPN